MDRLKGTKLDEDNNEGQGLNAKAVTDANGDAVEDRNAVCTFVILPCSSQIFFSDRTTQARI